MHGGKIFGGAVGQGGVRDACGAMNGGGPSNEPWGTPWDKVVEEEEVHIWDFGYLFIDILNVPILL